MAQYEGAGGRDNLNQNDIDLGLLAQNDQHLGLQQDQAAILNECREIHKGIAAMESNIEDIKKLQQPSLDYPDSSQQSVTDNRLGSMNSDIMTMYCSFAACIKNLKQRPASGNTMNAPGLGNIDRRLKAAVTQHQNIENNYRKRLQTQLARQYKILRPDASDAEVDKAVEDAANQQDFSQAQLQRDCSGRSGQAPSNVQNSHAEIQKIESQMSELKQILHDMEALVVQQESAVAQAEQHGEHAQGNFRKHTGHSGLAFRKAYARRMKYYFLYITAFAIITVIVVTVVYSAVQSKP